MISPRAKLVRESAWSRKRSLSQSFSHGRELDHPTSGKFAGAQHTVDPKRWIQAHDDATNSCEKLHYVRGARTPPECFGTWGRPAQ